MKTTRKNTKVVVVGGTLLVVLAFSLLAFAGELNIYGDSLDPHDAGFDSISILAPTQGNTSMYIKFDGVDGETQDKDYQNWSDILAFSQGQTTSGTVTGATRIRGDCVFEDVVIVKEIDKASPKLAEAVCKAKVFPLVEIHVAGSYGFRRETYYTYEFKNARVVSYHVDGSIEERPTEEVTFGFEEIKVTYTEMDDQGRALGNIEYTWKVEEGMLF